MFKALMKVQLASVIASLTRSSKGNEKRSAASGALIAVLFVFVAGVLVFAFGAMFYALAAPMHSASLDWFYFAMAALTAFALCFIGSVFTAQQQLFSARDNELLLAMPIKPKFILGSRMVMLLAIDYALELLVMAPAAVIWGVQVGYSAAGVAALVVGILLLPLLVLTFTCIIAWVLAAVSSRMRNKTIVTMVLYLAFLAAYFYVYMNFNNILTGLIANSAQLAGGVAVVYPVYAFGQAIAAGNLLHMAGFAACCAVPFAIVYAVLSRGFLSVTMRRPAAKKLVYREQKLAVSSASGALLKKELRHFGANGMYILNASLGSILTIAAAVALIIYRDTLVTVLGELPQGWTAAFMTIALCFLCATDVISAPSISLEGKTLWLLKKPAGKAAHHTHEQGEPAPGNSAPAHAHCLCLLHHSPPDGRRRRCGRRAHPRAHVRLWRAAGRGDKPALPQVRLHQRDGGHQKQHVRHDNHVRLLGRAGRAGDTLRRRARRRHRPDGVPLHLCRAARRRLRCHVRLPRPGRRAPL